MYLASGGQLSYTPSVERVVGWTILETQPVRSEIFLPFQIMSCSHEKIDQALPAFPYCKRWKAGRGLGNEAKSYALTTKPLQPLDIPQIFFFTLIIYEYLLLPIVTPSLWQSHWHHDYIIVFLGKGEFSWREERGKTEKQERLWSSGAISSLPASARFYPSWYTTPPSLCHHDNISFITTMETKWTIENGVLR